MNLPKFIFKIAFFCFLLGAKTRCFSQKDSAIKFLRISFDAAVIVNKTFSHFEEPSTLNHHYTEEFSEIKNSPTYLPGFSFGLTGRMGKTEHDAFIFGISASLTQARYHFYFSEYPDAVTLPSKSFVKNVDISTQSIYLNYEIGYRFLLFKKIFLQQTFIINQNIQTIQKENGNKISQEFSYVQNPDGNWVPHVNKTDELIHSTRYFPDKTQVSVRLNVFYGFKIRSKSYTAFIFRNFVLKRYYKLPWWGLGVSVPL